MRDLLFTAYAPELDLAEVRKKSAEEVRPDVSAPGS
jgi:hypothetical protein